MRFLQREIIDNLSAACHVHLDERQREGVERYLAFLYKWQVRINLTTVQDPIELLQFHFLEAFWAAHLLPRECSSVADVGSGGGFPGMAMKLYRPELSALLIEKHYKKALFLVQLAAHLGLDVEVFQGRAEVFPRWPSVRIATMRALRPSRELLKMLRGSGTDLLLFHGKNRPQLEAWCLLESQKFPLSENRFFSLYTPIVTRQPCST